jgi:hypothetical protein
MSFQMMLLDPISFDDVSMIRLVVRVPRIFWGAIYTTTPVMIPPHNKYIVGVDKSALS